jgi:hypothetical protein
VPRIVQRPLDQVSHGIRVVDDEDGRGLAFDAREVHHPPIVPACRPLSLTHFGLMT